MKIFITGGTGFIGKQVLKILSVTTHELFCLLRTGRNRKDLAEFPKLNIIEGDISNKNSVIQGMQGCDWVINLAGLYSYWEPDNKMYTEINVNGTRNVMEAALETRVSKIVHVSTVVTYGKQPHKPINEESEAGPRFTTYSETKFRGDQIVWKMFRENSLPVVVIYPCGVLGAGDPNVSGIYISDFVHKRLPGTLFNDSVHTWVHVRDVAQAIVRALEKSGNIGQKYFIGKEMISFREFNKMIAEISGVPKPALVMPGFLSIGMAYLLTGISRITKKRPFLGMSVEQLKIMKEGVRSDGSKAERELGIKYTPVRIALEEAIRADLKS